MFFSRFFRFKNREKILNDGIFLSNMDGTYEVLYSKYSFLKKGDVISYGVYIEVLPLYKCVMVSPQQIDTM